MWPSRNNNNGSSSSPSKSSCLCSSPSSPCTPNTSKRSMEEVWQDISLTSLQDHNNNSTSAAPNTTSTTAAGLIFQDFFASNPFNKDPPTTTTTKYSSPVVVPQSTHHQPSNNSCFGGSSAAPHHGTLLSLNSGSPGFQYLENINIAPLYDHHQRPSQQLLHGSPFVMASAQVVPSICLKRPQENGDHSKDRQHKRMIKNRESASRSRARKQAYTTELEQEVAHLVKENAKLRRQQEQLLMAASVPKKHSLYRTSTAPF